MTIILMPLNLLLLPINRVVKKSVSRPLSSVKQSLVQNMAFEINTLCCHLFSLTAQVKTRLGLVFHWPVRARWLAGIRSVLIFPGEFA